jgi:RND family efflux transporter MFP subunit
MSAMTRLFSRRVLFVLLLVAAGAGFAVYKQGSGAPPEAGETASAAKLVFATTDVATVEAKALTHALAISGSLNPVTQALVKARTAGEVLRVQVREGEAVTRGQLLVEIDTTDLKNRLAAAQADLEERRARFMVATRNRETNEALLKRAFISQSAFDQTQGNWQAGEAAVHGGEAQVRLARTALEDATVRAPIAGSVAKRLINPGERVGPESPLLNLVDLSMLELEVTVPAADISRVSLGQAARFAVDGFAGREFVGRVSRINPTTEAGSRAIKLFIEVPNADRTLKGGMFAQGGLVLAQAAANPVVPVSALFEEAGQSYVFAIANGKLEKRSVRLGFTDAASGLVALESGVASGDVVVRLRMNGLKDGAPAELRSGAAN